MKHIFTPFRWLYGSYAFVCFIVIMLLLLPFVVISSFFGRIKGGNAIFFLCRLWARLWYFLIGIRHRNQYETAHNFKKQYIFVANHISFLDAPNIVLSISQPVRPLGRAETAKVPVFGFIYRNAIVTVDRGKPAARAKSVRILKAVLRKGISIFIFPEGTFNETGKPLKDFYDGAFRIAIETGTPIKPLLFLDGYNRMHYSSFFTLQPGINRTIYLQEIPVEGLTQADLPQLKQQVYKLMEEKLIQYRASWITDPN